MRAVGRSERSDLRHGKSNDIIRVGGRYARSDLQEAPICLNQNFQDFQIYRIIV